MSSITIAPSEIALPTLPAQQPAAASSAGTDFAAELANAIKDVDKLQTGADAQMQQLAIGAGNLHETSIALDKADVGMRVAMKVRNKVVDAYQEVMRMSV